MLRDQRPYDLGETGKPQLWVELAQSPHGLLCFHRAAAQSVARGCQAHGGGEVWLAPKRSFGPNGSLIVATGAEMGERHVILPGKRPRIERAESHCDRDVLDRDL